MTGSRRMEVRRIEAVKSLPAYWKWRALEDGIQVGTGTVQAETRIEADRLARAEAGWR